MWCHFPTNSDLCQHSRLCFPGPKRGARKTTVDSSGAVLLVHGGWRQVTINPFPGLGGSKHTQLFLNGSTEARGKLGFPKKLS